MCEKVGGIPVEQDSDYTEGGQLFFQNKLYFVRFTLRALSL